MSTKYEYLSAGDISSITFSNAAAGGYWIAQTFTPSTSHAILSVKLKLNRTGTPGTITVSIRATSGGVPTGADLVSGTTNGDTLTTNLAVGEWREIAFASPIVLSADTKYAIVMRTTSIVPTNYAGARGGASGYGSGNYCYDGVDDGATWTEETSDLLFEEWGVPVFPVDSITRVTNIIHRYNRAKQVYSMEVSLGEVTTDFGIPTWDEKPQVAITAKADKPATVKDIEETVTKQVQIPQVQAPAPAIVSQPAELTKYAKDILATPAGQAGIARQKGIQQGVEAVVTPYAINVLRKNQEAATITTRIQFLTQQLSKGSGITQYAKDVLTKEIARLRGRLDTLYKK